jgi:hypothetical protein
MIPGPRSRRSDLLEYLRENSGYRIYRTGWSWAAYKPGHPEEIQAPTLEELEAKIMPPAGDDGDAATPPGTAPPAGT